MEKTPLSCIDCGAVNCKYHNRRFPDFCLTTNLDPEELRQALREDGLLVGYDAAEDALSFHPQMLTLEQTWEACRILERRVLHGEEA